MDGAYGADLNQIRVYLFSRRSGDLCYLLKDYATSYEVQVHQNRMLCELYSTKHCKSTTRLSRGWSLRAHETLVRHWSFWKWANLLTPLVIDVTIRSIQALGDSDMLFVVISLSKELLPPTLVIASSIFSALGIQYTSATSLFSQISRSTDKSMSRRFSEAVFNVVTLSNKLCEKTRASSWLQKIRRIQIPSRRVQRPTLFSWHA